MFYTAGMCDVTYIGVYNTYLQGKCFLSAPYNDITSDASPHSKLLIVHSDWPKSTRVSQSTLCRPTCSVLVLPVLVDDIFFVVWYTLKQSGTCSATKHLEHSYLVSLFFFRALHTTQSRQGFFFLGLGGWTEQSGPNEEPEDGQGKVPAVAYHV